MPRNDGFEHAEVVGPGSAGRSVLTHLIERYPHSSRVEWRGRIESGEVSLDGEQTTPGVRLRAGQRLAWRRPPWIEPEAPAVFAVLHDDEDLLAVAKPAGLPTLPGGGFFRHTLSQCVRVRDPDASPLHRLGRWTSGLVLFARTDLARADLSRQWSQRRVYKRYRALAAGRPSTDRFDVRVPIGPVPYPALGTVHAASPDGKESSSRVVVIERRAEAFVCDVVIETGRPHQIRIHLAAAGHPLVGDPLYAVGGRPNSTGRAVPGDGGYLLHAAELRFRHPREGSPVTLNCMPPPALRTRRH